LSVFISGNLPPQFGRKNYENRRRGFGLCGFAVVPAIRAQRRGGGVLRSAHAGHPPDARAFAPGGTKSVAWNRETLAGFEVTPISTAYQAVNYQELADWSPCIVDPRNAMAGVNVNTGKVWKA
jgi:hypothetical protein